MKSLTFILLLASFSNFCLSQDESEYPITYEITVLPRPQTILLTKSNDSTYSGKIITRFWKGRSVREKQFFQNMSVEKAKSIFETLKSCGIEKILDYDDGSPAVTFLDSRFVNLSVINDTNKIVQLGLEEIYPLTISKLEKTKLRLKLQELITVLFEKLDLEARFKDLLYELPRGKYSYWMGNGTVEINTRGLKKRN